MRRESVLTDSDKDSIEIVKAEFNLQMQQNSD